MLLCCFYPKVNIVFKICIDLFKIINKFRQSVWTTTINMNHFVHFEATLSLKIIEITLHFSELQNISKNYQKIIRTKQFSQTNDLAMEIFLFLHECIFSLYLMDFPEYVENSCTHLLRSSKSCNWIGVKQPSIVKKCFSSLLMRGIGNSLYTTLFSATTMSLKNKNGFHFMKFSMSCIYQQQVFKKVF